MRRDLVCLRQRRDDRQAWLGPGGDGVMGRRYRYKPVHSGTFSGETDVGTHETAVEDFVPFRAIACRFKAGWTPLRRPCTVCSHPQRREIDEALVGGSRTIRDIAGQFEVAPTSLRRHAKHHLVEAIKRGKELVEAARAGLVGQIPRRAAMDEALVVDYAAFRRIAPQFGVDARRTDEERAPAQHAAIWAPVPETDSVAFRRIASQLGACAAKAPHSGANRRIPAAPATPVAPAAPPAVPVVPAVGVGRPACHRTSSRRGRAFGWPPAPVRPLVAARRRARRLDLRAYHERAGGRPCAGRPPEAGNGAVCGRGRGAQGVVDASEFYTSGTPRGAAGPATTWPTPRRACRPWAGSSAAPARGGLGLACAQICWNPLPGSTSRRACGTEHLAGCSAWHRRKRVGCGWPCWPR